MTDERRVGDENVDRREVDRRHHDDTRAVSQTDDPMTGPRSADDPRSPQREPIESHRTSRQMDSWPEMNDFRQRFDQLQADFIEEPREAVRKAEELVEEAMNRMTSTMRDRLQVMRRDAESGDTENLRQAMRSLRDFIESLGVRRAA